MNIEKLHDLYEKDFFPLLKLLSSDEQINFIYELPNAEIQREYLGEFDIKKAKGMSPHI